MAIGIASALRLEGFRGEILGVQPAGNTTLFTSWQEGRPVQMDRAYTCCDALTATSVPQEAFDLLRSLLDGVLRVQEQSVLSAVRHLLVEEGLVAEPGAAVGMAAVLEEQVPADGTLLILSGRNVEPALLRSLLG
jgi:threonine dehydratase